MSQRSVRGAGSFSASRSVTQRCSLDAIAVQSSFNCVSGLSSVIDLTCSTLKPSVCACGTSNPVRSAEISRVGCLQCAYLEDVRGLGLWPAEG
jgi:hypothetical protein